MNIVHLDLRFVTVPSHMRRWSILGQKAEVGARLLREEFIKSLERKKVATVSNSAYESIITLKFNEVGLIPSEAGKNNMQFRIEVEATMTDRSGRVIWKTHYGSYPHNDQLPVRHLDSYKAKPSLLKDDFILTCRHVSDLLTEDLKSQMTVE